MSVWTTAGIIADGTFDDPENARIIYLAVGGLLLLAIGLGVGTWYWWRTAKVEHPALGPLEVMGTRRWWRSDFNDRRRRLEAARPLHDADGDGVPDPAAPVDLDLVMTRDDPQNFDDLLDPAPAPAPDPAPDAAPDASPAEVAVAAVEPVDEPVDEPASDVATATPDAAADLDPPVEPELEPEPEQLVLVAIDEVVLLRPAIITVDTAPKRVEPAAEAVPASEPEVRDSDPTPVPIDPLLRLQID